MAKKINKSIKQKQYYNKFNKDFKSENKWGKKKDFKNGLYQKNLKSRH